MDFEGLFIYIKGNIIAILALTVSVLALWDKKQTKKNEKYKIVYQETKSIIDKFDSFYSTVKQANISKKPVIENLLMGNYFLIIPKVIFCKHEQELRLLPSASKEAGLLLTKIEKLEKYHNNFKPTREVSQGMGFPERPDPREWATTDKAKEYTEDIFKSLNKINKVFNRLVDRVKIIT